MSNPSRPQQHGNALLAAGIKPCHPGEFFARRILPSLNMSPDQAAKALGVQPDFFNGRSHVNDVVAANLARLSGTSEQFWKNMQAGYDQGEKAAATGKFVPAPLP